MLCKRCAAIIDDGDKICIHCGADQEEIRNKKNNAPTDSEDRVMTFADYIITFFIGGIPLIGFIMLMIWSFGVEKIKGRSTVARAFLLWSIFVSLLVIVGFIYLCIYALKTADIQ